MAAAQSLRSAQSSSAWPPGRRPPGLAPEQPHASDHALLLNFQAELVAGADDAVEARLVHFHQVEQRMLAGVHLAGQLHQQPRGLCQRLDDQHTGMTGWPGKWPWKNGSLMVTFLMR